MLHLTSEDILCVTDIDGDMIEVLTEIIVKVTSLSKSR